jgi:predicted dehydrogenase
MQEVIDLSRKTGLKVYIVHNYSFVPCMRKAKSTVLKEKPGRIRLVETSYFIARTLSNFHLGVRKFLTVLFILLFVAFGYLLPFRFESKGDFKSTRV